MRMGSLALRACSICRGAAALAASLAVPRALAALDSRLTAATGSQLASDLTEPFLDGSVARAGHLNGAAMPK